MNKCRIHEIFTASSRSCVVIWRRAGHEPLEERLYSYYQFFTHDNATQVKKLTDCGLRAALCIRRRCTRRGVAPRHRKREVFLRLRLARICPIKRKTLILSSHAFRFLLYSVLRQIYRPATNI